MNCKVILTLAFLIVFQLTNAQQTFYVAKNGNDNWSGTLQEPNINKTDGPFASVKHAKDVVKGISNNGNIVVNIREGVYYQNEILNFLPSNSGKANQSITYQNYSGEKVVISGGFEISGWTKQGTLLVTEIQRVKNGTLYFHELYVNDERRIRARNPNINEYFHINGSIEGQEKRCFKFNTGELLSYDNPNDVNIGFYQSWVANQFNVDYIDFSNNILYFKPTIWFGTTNFDNRARYYVENAFELLDSPGEWYLNRTTGKLYYYPLENETPENIQAVAPVLNRVIDISGNPNSGEFVEYLNFEGISFKHSDWTLSDQNKTEGQAHNQFDEATIYMKSARFCSFKNCEVTLGGAHGIIQSVGCSNNLVQKCHLHALGGGGVYIGNTSEVGACKQLSNYQKIEYNTVDNCFIHDLTHIHHGSVGIWVGTANNNTITHNEICDLDYTGISVGWCWEYAQSSAQNNLINNNHIHHIMNGELSDGAGIYTLGNSPGTVVSNNLIHDVYAYAVGSYGLYADQASSGILWENNIVYNTKSEGFHQHWGQNNTIRNNIFAFCDQGGYRRAKDESGKSFTLENNIILTNKGIQVREKFSDKNFTINKNIYWDFHSKDKLDFDFGTFQQWQQKGNDLNGIVADPVFSDAEKFKFSLLSGSPALSLGFKQIDQNSMGLYGDEEWKNLPGKFQRHTVDQGAAAPIVTFFNLNNFTDNFDSDKLYSYPRNSAIFGNTGYAGQSAYVSNLQSKSGSQSVRFDDRSKQTNTYEPFLVYYPYWYESGNVTAEFDIYMENKSKLLYEWRDNRVYPASRGVSFTLNPGDPFVNGSNQFNIPVNEWFHVKINCPIGPIANGIYSLSITVGEKTITKSLNLVNQQFNSIYEALFISVSNDPCSFFIDNLNFEYNRAGGNSNANLPFIKEKTTFPFNIFPNPVKSHLNFATASRNFQYADIEVFDLEGKKVMEVKNENLDDCQINVNRLKSGHYLVRLTNNNRVLGLNMIVKL